MDFVTDNIIKDDLASLFNECNSIFAPPPDESVSDWAPKNINMSTKHDSIGGPYVPFAYQIEPLNLSADLSVREIIFKTSAQIGKTWSLLIMAAHRMKTRPSGIVWAMDSKESVDFLSASRFDPMVEESQTLSELVAKKAYKSSKNSKYYKDYLAGWIRFVTAGSARQLASAPAPMVLGDEIDKWPLTKEGDALSLLQARTKMQINPLCVWASTPSIKGASRIDALYEASDQRRYYVPCYHCQKEHLLIFDNLKWDSEVCNGKEEFNRRLKILNLENRYFLESNSKKYKIYYPDTAYMVCPECASEINDYEKNIMVNSGRWIAARPFMGSAGFHLNEFYSPKRTFSDIAEDFLKKKDDPTTNQVFVNATLGEVYEIQHDKMKSGELADRRENYYQGYNDEDTEAYVEPVLPKDGAILTAGVDVQLDRIEVTVRLWGLAYESWGIEHLILYGDPFQDIVWGQLNRLLDKEYKHPNGMKLRIQKCAIDTGYATDQVYNFINYRKWPCVAIKGKGGAGIPVHNGNPTTANDYKVPLYNIGSDTIKNTLYQRSFIGRDGPGKIHWNQNYSDTYFEQYTAERRIKKKVTGGEVYVWELPAGKKNEGLDIEQYAYAALHLIGIGDMDATIKEIIEPPIIEKERSPDHEINTFTDDL